MSQVLKTRIYDGSEHVILIWYKHWKFNTKEQLLRLRFTGIQFEGQQSTFILQRAWPADIDMYYEAV